MILPDYRLQNVGVKFNTETPICDMEFQMESEMESEMTIEPLGIALITVVILALSGIIIYCCRKKSNAKEMDNPEVELKD